MNGGNRMKLSRLIVSALVVASGLVVVAGVNSPAQAAKCSTSGDSGNKRAVRTGYSKRWTIKQSSRRENFSGAKRVLTFKSGSSGSVTNKVAGYAKASAEAGIGWAKLKGEVGGSLENVGTVTKYTEFTEQISLASGHVYIYARGARKHKMNLTFQQCQYQHPAGYIWKTYDTSTATGWVYADTWIACDASVPAGSFSKKVKKARC